MNPYAYIDNAKAEGNDGIIVKAHNGKDTLYIVFNPNQIKLIENKAPTKKDDIRYSLSDIDKFSERQYNDYAWAQVNDVLSRGEAKTATQEGTYGEIEQFNKKFSELKRQKGQFPQTSNGEHMLSVENKIVYVAGTFQSPKISQIVEIDAKDGDELAVVMQAIYNQESIGAGYDKYNKIIESFEQLLTRVNRKDFATFAELKRQASLSPKDNTGYWNGKPRGYNFEESGGSGESGRIKGKTQYSVADTYSAKKAYTRNEMKAVVDNITAFGVFGDELAKIAKGKTVDKIYELMNSAPIGKEAEYAEKFAEFMVENATTMVNGDEEILNMQAEIVGFFKSNVMKKFNLSSIKREIKATYDKSAPSIMLWWSDPNGRLIDAFMHDNEAMLRNHGIVIESNNSADIFNELYQRYKAAKDINYCVILYIIIILSTIYVYIYIVLYNFAQKVVGFKKLVTLYSVVDKFYKVELLSCSKWASVGKSRVYNTYGKQKTLAKAMS